MNPLKKIGYGLLKKLKFLPPGFYVKIYYEYYTGKKLNLENPVEFNEKIQWLKVFYHPPILTQLVDKYSVREYVKEKIGEKYLNELIAVYDKASEVDFDELPEKFVIKGVHGFHFNLIVKDKSELNRNKAKFLLHKWMRKNQYYRGGLEWAYKNVQPRLIAEKYLEEMDRGSITDYKFFCFNGKVEFMQVDLDRDKDHCKDFYDLDWKKLPFTKGKKPSCQEKMERPENLPEMKKLAEKLAGNFPFVRVDFYNISGKVFFGEMTFYPSDGRAEFYPEKYNKIIGGYMDLPEIPAGVKTIQKL